MGSPLIAFRVMCRSRPLTGTWFLRMARLIFRVTCPQSARRVAADYFCAKGGLVMWLSGLGSRGQIAGYRGRSIGKYDRARRHSENPKWVQASITPSSVAQYF